MTITDALASMPIATVGLAVRVALTPQQVAGLLERYAVMA